MSVIFQIIVSAGETIIKEGDDGDTLYIVDSGELECTKKGQEKSQELIKVYISGEIFGELALLYNSPRMATIVAKTDSVLYSLDRETFNHIVRDAAIKKRENYQEFLSKVEILQEMSNYERQQIVDALVPLSFAKGEYIMKEGEPGDTFFILKEGTAVALKSTEDGGEPKEIYCYKPGEYFGEIALLRGTQRSASIKATVQI